MKTDCLIIGGGLSALWAAREVVHAGLNGVMVQDGPGASPWVHGFNKPVRPGDSPEVFLRDTLKSGLGLSDPQLAEALSGDTEIIFRELTAMGLQFNRNADGDYQAIRPLGASYPRVISIGNETGTAVMERLRREIDGKIREISHARALRLIREGDRVAGALIWQKNEKKWLTVSAKAVILACGGFCRIFPVSTNKRDSGGDGIAMAFEAGARLCDMEFIQFEPSAAVWPPALIGTSMITTLFFEGAVLRNRQGERFMLRYGEDAERVGKDVLAKRIAQEIAAGNGTEHGGVYMDITGVPEEKLLRDYPMYVERYRNVGIDITREWIELAPAPHTALGGVKADASARTDVSGLFVCGEMLGGLHGANRIGGSAGLETMVFGRRAGRTAAAYAASVPETEEIPTPVMRHSGQGIADEILAMRRSMQDSLMRGVGAIRTEETLSETVQMLKALLDRTGKLDGADDEESFDLFRLKNDLTTALIVAEAAEARRESRGCHQRADYPDTEASVSRIIIARGPDGLPDIQRMELKA